MCRFLKKIIHVFYYVLYVIVFVVAFRIQKVIKLFDVLDADMKYLPANKAYAVRHSMGTSVYIFCGVVLYISLSYVVYNLISRRKI